jgi:cytochrome P450
MVIIICTDNTLPNFISDLFLAGAETTATTMGWAYLCMAEYADVQDKCYQEIDSVGSYTSILSNFFF